MRTAATLVLLLLAAGCRSTGVVEGRALAADGVEIAYDSRGAGETALVFVHGWAADRTSWRRQLDVFADDYRVVSVDLGGHGASGGGRRAWSVFALGGDVEAVVDHLDLERVLLVGHSMGGPVSLEAARRMPTRVAGVIGVDTLHDAEIEFKQEDAEAFVARLEAEFEKTLADAVRLMFGDGTPPDVIDGVIAMTGAVDRAAALALIRDYPRLDLETAFSRAGVPIRCINAAPRPPFDRETRVETNRKYADYDAVIMADVGHYLMLERPDEFNARLRAVLAGFGSRR